MRRATSLIHIFDIEVLLNLRSIILILIFVNVKILIRLMLFLEHTRGRPSARGHHVSDPWLRPNRAERRKLIHSGVCEQKKEGTNVLRYRQRHSAPTPQKCTTSFTQNHFNTKMPVIWNYQRNSCCVLLWFLQKCSIYRKPLLIRIRFDQQFYPV